MTIRMTESVTNAEYRRFDPSHTFPEGHDNKPVTNVTYGEAMAYAAWLSQETGRRFRLPTEQEREAAESTFEADYSNHPLPERPDVGTFGKNADGVTGLKGTVYDWCLDAGDLNRARAAWEPQAEETVGETGRVARGGCWLYTASYLRASLRSRLDPSYRSSLLGFRLVEETVNPTNGE